MARANVDEQRVGRPHGARHRPFQPLVEQTTNGMLDLCAVGQDGGGWHRVHGTRLAAGASGEFSLTLHKI
jgi:hypothetical protein